MPLNLLRQPNRLRPPWKKLVRGRCGWRRGGFRDTYGFLSFDALFSLLPLVLMLMFIINFSALVADGSASGMHRQAVFDKVASVADYTVKTGYAMVGSDGLKRPNWMREEGIGEEYVAELRERTGLAALEITYGEPEGLHDVCIYRLVVVGETKGIAQLTVCGDG